MSEREDYTGIRTPAVLWIAPLFMLGIMAWGCVGLVFLGWGVG